MFAYVSDDDEEKAIDPELQARIDKVTRCWSHFLILEKRKNKNDHWAALVIVKSFIGFFHMYFCKFLI